MVLNKANNTVLADVLDFDDAISTITKKKIEKEQQAKSFHQRNDVALAKIKDIYDKNQAVQACNKYFSNYQIAIIYLAGSQMRHTATKTSDVDLVVIVNSNVDDVLFHKPLVSKQVNFTSNDIEYDCKVYDKNRFYDLINKCSPELIEVLQYQPIYCDNLDKDLCNFLYQKRHSLFLLNPVKSFKAFQGNILNTQERTPRNTDMRKLFKGQAIINAQTKLLANFLQAQINPDCDLKVMLTDWETNLLPNFKPDQQLIKNVRQVFKDNLTKTLKKQL